jgi:hypothetical protein
LVDLGGPANGVPSVMTANELRELLGQLARIDTAQAPADEADLIAAGLAQVLQAGAGAR